MSGPESAKRLKAFIERIEKVETDQQGNAEAKRDIYKEAKDAGFDARTIRWAVSERKLSAADRAERDDLRDTYAHALGLAVDAVLSGEMSARDAATMYGVGKTSVYKEIGVRALSAQHREMTMGDLAPTRWVGKWGSENCDEVMLIAQPRKMTADDLGDPLLVIDKPRAQFREKVRAIAASIKAPPPVEMVAAPEWDDLAIPPFLRRTA
jgi:uncharacterized protein (UPF0335 family)